MINDALILAGGKGIRLKPITRGISPKALVKLTPDMTMLDYAVSSLQKLKITNITVSLGHQQQQILKHYDNRKQIGNTKPRFLCENEPLGTGGAVDYFIKQGQKEPFLVTSADNYLDWLLLKDFIKLPDCDLSNIIALWGVNIHPSRHTQSHVKNNIWYEKTSRKMVAYLSTATKKQIKEVVTYYGQHPEKFANAASSGIVIINPRLYHSFVQNEQIKKPYCLFRDVCPRWVPLEKKQGRTVKVFFVDSEVIDMGTPERLRFVRSHIFKFHN